MAGNPSPSGDSIPSEAIDERAFSRMPAPPGWTEGRWKLLLEHAKEGRKILLGMTPDEREKKLGELLELRHTQSILEAMQDHRRTLDQVLRRGDVLVLDYDPKEKTVTLLERPMDGELRFSRMQAAEVAAGPWRMGPSPTGSSSATSR